jgi:replicative DNA helicase
VEDVDSWLNSYLSGLRGSVSNGPEGYQFSGDIAAEAIDEVEQIRSGEVSLLLPIGLPSMTRVNLIPYGNLVVLHGMSNSGKTSLMLEMALGTAIGLGKNNISGCVAINSLETPANVVIRNMAAMLSGFNTQKLYQGKPALQGQDYQEFLKAIEYIGTLPIYVDPTNLIKTTVMEYRLNGIHSSDRGPVRFLGSDYTELFSDDDGDSKEQNLTSVIRKHLQIARETGAAVVTISQSTYGVDGDHKARIAGAGGLRYSQGLRHAADIVLEIVNYPEMKRKGIDYRVPDSLDDSHFWILVEKTRGFGTPEPIPMFWEGESTRVLDPNLTFGKSETMLFDHFLKEEEKIIKPVEPVVQGTNGNGDWSTGLEGIF